MQLSEGFFKDLNILKVKLLIHCAAGSIKCNEGFLYMLEAKNPTSNVSMCEDKSH